VNTRAQVVGINTAIIPGSQGIGFAINIDDVKVVVAQLLATGTVERGFLGINMFSMNPGLANQLGVPVLDGVAVAAVGRGNRGPRRRPARGRRNRSARQRAHTEHRRALQVPDQPPAGRNGGPGLLQA